MRSIHRAPPWVGWVRWLAWVMIATGLLILVRVLPVQEVVRWLKLTVEGMGWRGPIVFGVVYVLAAILFVPGSALTLAAGALFGWVKGTAIVSVASTTAAAVAFLIARHWARPVIKNQARAHPRFNVVDKAIGQEGWKIVALLRLSPVIPYNLSNYLYGLTAVGFRPYVLASWVGMFPGTVLCVYLGWGASRVAVGEHGQWGQNLMLAIGLATTVGVTVYITRLARGSLSRHTEIYGDENPSTPSASTGHGVTRMTQATPSTTGWPWGTKLLMGLAVVVLTTAVTTSWNRAALSGWFGPPRVHPAEAYEDQTNGPTFDHAVFDALLKKHVDPNGWVDYHGLRADADTLDRYIRLLADAPFDQMGRNQKLALLINAYNAFTLRLILDHLPVASIKDIPADERWDARRWRVGLNTWSLNQIEHEQVRPNFREPRIHFALVCAAVGCPPLRNEAYQADRLDEQLQDQARYVHHHGRWFRFEPDPGGRGVVYLTKLYKWYGGDFEQVDGTVLTFAARYIPPLRAALDQDRVPPIRWLDYDWKLNDVGNRP